MLALFNDKMFCVLTDEYIRQLIGNALHPGADRVENALALGFGLGVHMSKLKKEELYAYMGACKKVGERAANLVEKKYYDISHPWHKDVIVLMGVN